jgi:hypothetical protein
MSTDPRPVTPIPKPEDVKSFADLFKKMEEKPLESFNEPEAKPLTEKEMEIPRAATREDFLAETTTNMTLKQQFATLGKFKDVPMTYAEMRARYG